MNIIIVGAVAGGMSAAARARRNDRDARIIVFERTDIVSFGACGLPYYVGGWFDDPSNMIARRAEDFIESGIDLRLFHEVLGVDVQNRTVTVKDLKTGRTFSERFDRLVIATGASPIVPPFARVDLENVFTLTTLPDGEALRSALGRPECREVTVVGAGFIGLETVEACLHLGKRVRLIQLDPRVLPDVFDPEITGIIEAELRAKGVELLVDEQVEALTGSSGRVERVRTDKGEYPTDLVVVSVGVRPNTAFLSGSGIETLGQGAIVVDASGRTNLEDIYAAGDCAAVPHALDGKPVYVPLATSANKLGRVVGDVVTGRTSSYPGSLGSACLKVLGLEAGRTGLSQGAAEGRGIPVKTVFVKDKDHANYWPGQEDIAVKLIYAEESRRLLGGQIVGGRGAVLRTDVLAAAIAGGATVDQLGLLDLCYAPPFSRTWDVLNVAGNVAK